MFWSRKCSLARKTVITALAFLATLSARIDLTHPLVTYLLRSLEPRYSTSEPLAELLRICAFLFVELVGDGLHLWDTPCDAPPGNVLEGRVALSV